MAESKTFSLADLEKQAKILRDFAAQLESAKDRAEIAGFKALEVGAGSKAFDRANSNLSSHITGVNRAITKRLGEED